MLEKLRSEGIISVPRLFRHRTREWADNVVMRDKELGIWREITWGDYGENAGNVAMALLDLGLVRGDRVAVISENCPEWLYCDEGIMAAGGVTVGIYTTDSSKQVEYIVNDCQAKFYFAEDEEQLDKILEVRDNTPSLEKIVVYDMKGLRDFSDPMVISFDTLLETGRAAAVKNPTLFNQSVDQAKPEDLAILVYTSGTTGPPKGAMLSHQNILDGMFLFYEIEPPPPGQVDEILTFLPLCHIAERNVSGFGPLVQGTVINFAESMATVPQDIREVSPTFYFAVPRIWEKFYSTLMLRMKDSTPLEKWAFKWAQGIGQKVAEFRIDNREPPTTLKVLYDLADRLVLKNIKKSIGLDKVRLCLSGAAPISPDLLKFYFSLGIDMREGYGQTESTGLATFHFKGRTKFGTIGEPIPSVNIKIADDGEILIKGPNVFMGYYKNPEKTKETIVDGWLHTGDVGRFDEDGHLIIMDRKKDIIITAGGKNITPSEIENQLKFSPYINDAVVIGDQRKYLTALIMIDEENVMEYAQEQRVPFTTFASMTKAPEIVKLIHNEVEAVNKNFARAETIKKFSLIDILLTTDDDEITPTMKLKRKFVSEKFKGLIDSMY
ncbi:MAG: long-chain fatty acid--CoA ligase [Proteobacteria bacterium]|nr:long-chain fatty acid--CoA ligase [Pseudomonadota bacterium]